MPVSKAHRGPTRGPLLAATAAPRAAALYTAAVLLVVCVLVGVAHGPALTAAAWCFDDNAYVLFNDLVRNPGWSSAGRFFREVLEPSSVQGYYQPLTMVSLMLDYASGAEQQGLRVFHRTSLALHVLNTGLVVLLLQQLFRRPLLAGLVGLLFGLHPVTVEPIPWLGERKTLLSAFFALACLNVYVRYVRHGGWGLYAVALVCFVLALLAKPISTPLPLVLLVLDWWPLRRASGRAVREKAPFFVVAGVSAVITYISQARTASVELIAQSFSAWDLVLQVCHNIAFYVGKLVWPVHLTPHYPFPRPYDLSQPALLAGLIVTPLILAAVLVSLRWTRALAAGFAIFVVLLAPTMAFVRFSKVIASDKFVYLPVVGLLLALAAGLVVLWDGLERRPARGYLRGGLLAVVLVLALAEVRATRAQYTHWRDKETLYRYMLVHAPHAAPVHDDLGVFYQNRGALEAALAEHRSAIAADPNYPPGHMNLGVALGKQQNFAAAREALAQAVALAPDWAMARVNLARALDQLGRPAEARPHYEEALRLKPDYVDGHKGLAVLLARTGQFAAAEEHFRAGLARLPHYVDLHLGLSRVLLAQRRTDEALGALDAAARYFPGEARLQSELQSLRALLADPAALEVRIAQYAALAAASQPASGPAPPPAEPQGGRFLPRTDVTGAASAPAPAPS